MRLRLNLTFIFIVLFLLIGCSPQRPAAVTLPTHAALPSAYLIEDAERVAREFLQKWQDGDIESMWSLISFNAREATNHDEFVTLYENSATEMTLQQLEYTPITIYRQQDNIAVFNYDAAFTTNLLGEFEDRNRNLYLVVDETVGAWRIAWSPGAIFTAMQSGGRLRFDPVVPNRANIYDVQGDVLANQNGRVIIINLIPQRIPTYDACLAALSSALNLPVETIEPRITTRPANWLIDVGIIETQVYLDNSAALETNCAATFTDRPARQYEDGELASHMVGYVGYPDPSIIPQIEAAGFTQDTILGRSGIELSWDSTLRGQPGGRLVIASPTGAIVSEVARVTAQPGQSVWLTIDRDLQAATLEILRSHYELYGGFGGSKGASVVMMDVHTGAILVSVSYPSYDNNAYTVYPSMGRQAALQIISQNTTDFRNPELNRVTQGVYALGSVMKTISAAAVTDSNVYAINQRYTCNAIWSRDITRFDWTSNPHGTLTVAGALTQSCNPYFYEVGYQANMVDPWILPNYARQLGFGGSTGLRDVPESVGLIPDPNWVQTTYGFPWTFSDSVNMSIGQGYVQITPLQVARWFSAIANGGNLPRPYLVSQFGLLGNPMNQAYEPEMTPTNLRPEVIDMIREGMCAVTTASYGTAEFVFRDSPLQTFGVCGKTGTAEDPPRLPHAWFAAYAPRENPEVAIVVMVENSGQGSEVAAPITRDVLEAYYGFRP